MHNEQYVCLVCGFNMIGYHPDNCPFCGVTKDNFITSEECSTLFKVKEIKVNDKVTRLNSVPSLGLEHAAYRVKTGDITVWVDCPSSFDNTLEPADVITFTHHHFLGAVNQYRSLFSAEVRLHAKDTVHDICREFPFDLKFVEDYAHSGLEATHIDGHTPGFTFYTFEDVLLVCDYVFLSDGGLNFNPYGNKKMTVEGGKKLMEVIEDGDFKHVCGYNYVSDYSDWLDKYNALLASTL